MLPIIIGVSRPAYSQETGQENIQPAIQFEGVVDFAISNHHSMIAFVDFQGRIFIWDILSPEILLQLETTPLVAALFNLSWSPDDQLIAASSSDKGRVWDTQTGALLYELDGHPFQPLIDDDQALFSSVYTTAFSPTGLYVATANLYDATVLLYDTQSHEIVHYFADHAAANGLIGIEEVIFSPDGSLLAARQWAGGIVVWDVDSGEKLYKVPGEAMAFNSNGTKLATGLGRFRSRIWVWDALHGGLISEFTAPLVAIDLQWLSDNQTMYALFNGWRLLDDGIEYKGSAVRSYDTVSESETHVFELADIQRLSLDLLEEEVLIGIGVAHIEGEVLVWNRNGGDVYRKSISPDFPSRDYSITTYSLSSFSLSADSHTLAAGYDNGVVVWDALSGKQLLTLSAESRIYKVEHCATQNAVIGLSINDILSVWLLN